MKVVFKTVEENQLSRERGRSRRDDTAALRKSQAYLQPFVDTIGERYGMCVSLLICGPIGERGGRIEMRRGLLENDWPRHDPKGFSMVETSMVEFAHNVFTQAERDARLTAVQVIDNPETAGTSASDSSASRCASAAPAIPSLSALHGAATTSPSTPASVTSVAAASTVDAARGSDAGGRDGNTADMSVGDNGEEGAGGAPGDGADADRAVDVRAVIEGLWKRKDRARWNDELKRAHSAFERIKDFGGIDWASCVDRFFDFEKLFGYHEDGSQISNVDRPEVVKRWLTRQRRWDAKMDVGVIGVEGTTGTYADDWWKWWIGVQPEERRTGPRGVLASLLWWAEGLAPEQPLDHLGWFLAVGDVLWTLEQMLKPGVIRKQTRKTEGTAGKGKKRKAPEETGSIRRSVRGAAEEEAGRRVSKRVKKV
ncbi:hypothetical protein B0H13DRAFT_1869996 [Mycena leptocephala]|nr:hypothetical protein B0H13DRAFT_1869996 [Mycena leptocephala]